MPHLRRHRVGGARNRPKQRLLLALGSGKPFRIAEVNELHLRIEGPGLEQDVLQLDVAVADSVLVAVHQGAH